MLSSFRLRVAGSVRTVVHSPSQVAVFEDVDSTLDVKDIAARFAGGADLVLAEGYKFSKVPKIEVSRRGNSADLVCAKSEDLIAVVADHKVDVSVPVFSMEDAEGVADLIEGLLR